MSKQDRQGVRTAEDVVRRFPLDKIGKGGGGGASDERLSQLSQSLSQFMATATAKFNEISGKMVEKVFKTGSDKEYKTLSDNDLTDELKEQYDNAYEHSTADHAPASAQENVIEKVNVNGAALSVEDKAVDVSVPVKVSELENDKGYLTEETDPTVPSWAKEPNKPVYNADEIGADKQGTAGTLISSHNTATDSHNDIRLLIQGLIARLDAVANSSDEELDQLSEIVAYIKSNKSLIDGITTSKVNVSDIVDNLTTNVKDKPLSATQGVVLKALIDAITVPTKVSELENDKGYLTQHQDLSAYAKKTELPTVPTKVSAFENDKGYLTQHQDLSAYAKKTDIPTVPSSLPANGGNADTVDGMHIDITHSAPTNADFSIITLVL